MSEWLDDPDEEEEGTDLTSLGTGQAETVAETIRLQCEAMQQEGYHLPAILAGLQQIAAEIGWDLAEILEGSSDADEDGA